MSDCRGLTYFNPAVLSSFPWLGLLEADRQSASPPSETSDLPWSEAAMRQRPRPPTNARKVHYPGAKPKEYRK